MFSSFLLLIPLNLAFGVEPKQLDVNGSIKAAAKSCEPSLENIEVIKSITLCETHPYRDVCGITYSMLNSISAGGAADATVTYFKDKVDQQLHRINQKLVIKLESEYHDNWRKTYQENGAKAMVKFEDKDMTRGEKETIILSRNKDAVTKPHNGMPNIKYSQTLKRHVDIAAFSLDELNKLGADDLVKLTQDGAKELIEVTTEFLKNPKFDPKDEKVYVEISKKTHEAWYARMLKSDQPRDPSYMKPWDQLTELQQKHNIAQNKTFIKATDTKIFRFLRGGTFANFRFEHAISAQTAFKKLGIQAVKGVMKYGLPTAGLAAEIVGNSTTAGCAELGAHFINLNESCKPVLDRNENVYEFLSMSPAEQKEGLKITAVCEFYNNLAANMIKDHQERKKFFARGLSCDQGAVVHEASKSRFEFKNDRVSKITVTAQGSIQHIYTWDNDGRVLKKLKQNNFETSANPVSSVELSENLFGQSVKALKAAPQIAGLYDTVCGKDPKPMGTSMPTTITPQFGID